MPTLLLLSRSHGHGEHFELIWISLWLDLMIILIGWHEKRSTFLNMTPNLLDEASIAKVIVITIGDNPSKTCLPCAALVVEL